MRTLNHKNRSQCIFTRCALLAVALLNLHLVQAQKQQTIGVLYIESRGVIPDAATLGGLVRIELEKTGRYSVVDWFEVRDVLARHNVDLNQCMGRTCVVEAGRLLNAEKMILGGVERFNERIAITLKVVDVATGEIERTHTTEYQNLQNELQRMIEITLKQLLGMETDPVLLGSLVAYNEPVANPLTRVNLSGPRFGVYMTDGPAGERLRGTENGGYGMSQFVSMFGWQQEKQYLSSGDFQCLFELLVTASGLESGRFIPAVAAMNGFRLRGWEIALGPVLRFVRKADGYYVGHDVNEDWVALSGSPSSAPEGVDIISNLDARGDVAITAGLVVGFGKTFRAGQMNIPLNVYMIPRQEGSTYGISMGFNVFKKKKN